MNLITLPGIIHFDPVNRTNKHNFQSSWKRMALVLLDGDVSEYYSWFIDKRYNLKLNKPLRGAHISFINDSINDMKSGLGTEDEQSIENTWTIVKNKYDNTPINIVLDVDARSDTQHWWLNIPNEHRTELHNIRAELGLGRPYFGLHMSIGVATGLNLVHSQYILRMIKLGLC